MKQILVFLFILTYSQIVAQKSSNAQRPNIVLIIADDLGYGDVGFNGQRLIKTPNLDKLAASGMIFSQFYAGTSVCAPSRSALLSGKHTGHTYIRGNKGVDPEGQEPIADSVITIAEILKQAGYTTAAYGKWGLGPVGSVGDPNKQGFDYFYGYNCQSLAHRYYPNHLWDNDLKIILEPNQNLTQNKIYAPDLIHQKSLDFIANQQADKPFFLFLPYILPHAELIAPDDSLLQYYKGKFEEKPYKGQDYGTQATGGGYASQAYPRATFAAMVARLDKYVGEVMQQLKAKGLDKNTLVIFSSDNGPHTEGGADPAFFHSSGIYKGVKRDLYEGGIREPFIAYWPKFIRSGSKSQYIGAFWDLLPTFAELAGTKAPLGIDGLSIAGVLTGKAKPQTHEYLYWEFHEQGGKQAIRQGKWKAVRLNVIQHPTAPIELYDLEKDPSETTNLASAFPEKAQELSLLMLKAHLPSALFPLGNQ